LVIKAEIANDARTAVVLRDHSKWGNAKVRQVGNCRKGKNSPEVFVDKVNHFLLKKVKELITRCVGTPGHGSTDLLA
jgi:hypothetical protein